MDKFLFFIESFTGLPVKIWYFATILSMITGNILFMMLRFNICDKNTDLSGNTLNKIMAWFLTANAGIAGILLFMQTIYFQYADVFSKKTSLTIILIYFIFYLISSFGYAQATTKPINETHDSHES